MLVRKFPCFSKAASVKTVIELLELLLHVYRMYIYSGAVLLHIQNTYVHVISLMHNINIKQVCYSP
jgi:hypothetical protein